MPQASRLPLKRRGKKQDRGAGNRKTEISIVVSPEFPLFRTYECDKSGAANERFLVLCPHWNSVIEFPHRYSITERTPWP